LYTNFHLKAQDFAAISRVLFQDKPSEKGPDVIGF